MCRDVFTWKTVVGFGVRVRIRFCQYYTDSICNKSPDVLLFQFDISTPGLVIDELQFNVHPENKLKEVYCY